MTIFLIDATSYEFKRKSIKNVDILTTTETNLGIKVFLHNELLIMFIRCSINPNIDSKLQELKVTEHNFCACLFLFNCYTFLM